MSPELEAISDRIKLDVKNAIVRLTGSYESMRRYANAAQEAAQEVAILQSRWDDLSGSDRDLPLYFRDLLDAQARLASVEQHYVTAQTSYSTAILELRRANGTIIDQCSFQTGGPVTGPGVPRSPSVPPVARPAAEYHAPELPQMEQHIRPPTRTDPRREPSGSILQAPQERLDTVPHPVRQRPSQKTPSVPSQQTPTLNALENRGIDDVRQIPRPSPQPTVPQTPYYYEVPQGELPMPPGEDVIPGRAAEDVRLYPPSSVQPYPFEDWGRASSFVPPLPQSQQDASPWGQLPAGEVPMPAGEQLIPGEPSLQLWQPSSLPASTRSSQRPIRRQ